MEQIVLNGPIHTLPVPYRYTYLMDLSKSYYMAHTMVLYELYLYDSLERLIQQTTSRSVRIRKVSETS